jgi:polyhydroxyalkanoate synthase
LPLFLDLLRSETAESPERRGTALAGLRRYQQAERTTRTGSPSSVASVGRARLIDGGGASGPPVVLVPSVINPPHVLDLAPGRSLIGYLAAHGHRPLLVDWGAPTPAERNLSLAGHVERYLLPLLDALGEAVPLVGYCLGGTMATAAAARRPTRGLALIASPWCFGGYSHRTLAALDGFWTAAGPAADALGLLPMELLQAAFWQLDPARTIHKYEALADADEAALAGFVTLEDWANDGPPLPFATARELFDDLFGIDLPGRGRWQVAGEPLDPGTIRAPILDITSTTDRIVPAGAALGRGERIELALGHVGMVVGRRAAAALWQPLERWLSALR